ncbi:uncharacterized protein BDW43DRAFT_258345 [Aspergillus alliaceus]|uniref:uncharacterized protein n=1 Tax=Petromyces alliaceus TaxID=209559 RepID=UPI0012A75D3E|nr:uncharacterized protein BDW43DRAFT_258345 [Aspergillus alliaceus]KAB8239504.1 hypothetical protein BDW43DRAFT_258345 [Aspergillus alliaceus]
MSSSNNILTIARSILSSSEEHYNALNRYTGMVTPLLPPPLSLLLLLHLPPSWVFRRIRPLPLGRKRPRPRPLLGRKRSPLLRKRVPPEKWRGVVPAVPPSLRFGPFEGKCCLSGVPPAAVSVCITTTKPLVSSTVRKVSVRVFLSGSRSSSEDRCVGDGYLRFATHWLWDNPLIISQRGAVPTRSWFSDSSLICDDRFGCNCQQSLLWTAG